jgi:hypothetical protein
MSVDLARFVRTTPLAILQKYLVRVDPEAFGRLDSKAPRQSLTPELLKTIGQLPTASRDMVLSDLDRVRQFEGEAGRRLLRGVLPEEPGDLQEFDALEDVSACALHVLMLGEEIFENALAAVFAQRLLNGRDWTGLDFEPKGKLALKPATSLALLEEKLREIFGDDGPRASGRAPWRPVGPLWCAH